MLSLVDTHSHIHDVSDFKLSSDDIIKNALGVGVDKIITVGTDVDNSIEAVEFAKKYSQVFALVGIHPGVDSNQNVSHLENLIKSQLNDKNKKLVGLGDIGLDYHYKPYNREEQIGVFEAQLELAVKYNLPISFHVREAFDDFWPVFDNFKGLRGMLHSYTDNVKNMEKGLARGLYISLNGILTFNKELELNKVFAQVPLNRVVFETDAPYLAPKPYRGKENQPSYVYEIAEYFAKKRDTTLDKMSKITTKNSDTIFKL